jgi:hypothetical protein
LSGVLVSSEVLGVPTDVGVSKGAHCGVNLIGVGVAQVYFVGLGVGVIVAGEPGHIDKLITENGARFTFVLPPPPPPPQLNSSAALRKTATGTRTNDLRNQIIEPRKMTPANHGVKLAQCQIRHLKRTKIT